MHPVASFQQLSTVGQNSVTSILACIAVTQRTWPHLVCVCVCARLRRVCSSNASSNASSNVQHQAPIQDAIKFADTSPQLHVRVNVMYSHCAVAHTDVRCVS